ncbi:GNAT family N-acetyltransferase [Methanocalculus sp.]|uniref:lipid II:glycine glycyltransferase FemX n=1 Tax=Methanocalculus sp. TaxID=2004547 RepID=UPI0026202A3A|nr:GNAT family N-acetyltransferase [Methanocalculus sp.]MDG6251042.1 GNAT family N-acetyltransferase [Methanocalculus sp.]
MAQKISIATENDAEQWNAAVESAHHSTLFHTWNWLKIVEKHTDTTLYPLMCYKGTTLVAIYPVFVQKKMHIHVALSPTSGAYLPYLGPVIPGIEAMKQDNKESLSLFVQEAVDDFLFSQLKCKYVRIRTPPRLNDARPFKWSGYEVDPLYTYRINLKNGKEQVWEGFEKKLRSNIKKAIKEGIRIQAGGREDIEFIHKSLSNRMTEQGLSTSGSIDYLYDLFDTFYPSNMKLFIALYEGQKVAGNIVLFHKDVVYSWVGLSKSDIRGLSPNDLVQWDTITWACNSGFDYYEIMDAGVDPRLRHFKSKYNPDIEIWYSALKYDSYHLKLLSNILKKT